MKFDDMEKASILLRQFSSVFTKEGDEEVPTIATRTQETTPRMQVTVEMVLKELHTEAQPIRAVLTNCTFVY
jgi:hypothetical protein